MNIASYETDFKQKFLVYSHKDKEHYFSGWRFDVGKNK